MAIEIVDLPTKNGGSFHSFLYVYQRVYAHKFPINFPLPAQKPRLSSQNLRRQPQQGLAQRQGPTVAAADGLLRTNGGWTLITWGMNQKKWEYHGWLVVYLPL